MGKVTAKKLSPFLLILMAGVLSGCQTAGIKTFPGEAIPEEFARPNLETVRYHFDLYTHSRGRVGEYNTRPSESPKELFFESRESPYIQKVMRKTYLASYLMYENGKVVVDEISPDDRLGNMVDNNTLLRSWSMAKSLAGYLMGHAICRGYIDSVDQPLSDWPLVQDTLIAEATVRDVLNASMGNQKYMSTKGSAQLASGRDVGMFNLRSIVSNELKGSRAGKKRFAYGDFPSNVALDYISFKTGHRFRKFLNDVVQNHIGLESTLKFSSRNGLERDGNIQSVFYATRYDTLRIGIAILEDWNEDNCVGRYMKDLYENRIVKGNYPKWHGYGMARGYAGFFHTEYPHISDTVMGMDGYGGKALLINFDKNRIVYGHAVHADFNFKKVITDPLKKGAESLF